MEKFFNDVQKPKDKPSSAPADQQDPEAQPKKAIPKGVVLGKDGKPCRSCTSVSSWIAMSKQSTSASPSSTTTDTSLAQSSSISPEPQRLATNCPPDVEELGRSSWTLLHKMSAAYPPTASPAKQSEMKQFLSLFSRLYPCWTCAEDFQEWMQMRGNEPRVGGRGELGRWMCEAHNEVNRKLGKGVFDCGGWEERWRTGPRDGSCG